MAFYRLPGFIAETLSSQPASPRKVPILWTILAVLAGADCAIYAGSGLVFIAVGLIFMTGSFGFAPAPIGASLIFVGIGLLPMLLVVFRIWQVERLLQKGDAISAEVTQAEVGPARLTGTPWGEPLGARIQPTAARGTYRFSATGETGRYYMQQSWALRLRPGDHIWVLRLNRRDVAYAPIA